MVSAPAFLGGCQNDYPLEPTPCDDFCRATQRPSCADNDPAWCVANCEDQQIAQLDQPGCQDLWDAALACYAALPDEDICDGWFLDFGGSSSGDCGTEASAYYWSCLAQQD